MVGGGGHRRYYSHLHAHQKYQEKEKITAGQLSKLVALNHRNRGRKGPSLCGSFRPQLCPEMSLGHVNECLRSLGGELVHEFGILGLFLDYRVHNLGYLLHA